MNLNELSHMNITQRASDIHAMQLIHDDIHVT